MCVSLLSVVNDMLVILKLVLCTAEIQKLEIMAALFEHLFFTGTFCNA